MYHNIKKFIRRLGLVRENVVSPNVGRMEEFESLDTAHFPCRMDDYYDETFQDNENEHYKY
jgi:hypothetical protein